MLVSWSLMVCAGMPAIFLSSHVHPCCGRTRGECTTNTTDQWLPGSGGRNFLDFIFNGQNICVMHGYRCPFSSPRIVSAIKNTTRSTDPLFDVRCLGRLPNRCGRAKSQDYHDVGLKPDDASLRSLGRPQIGILDVDVRKARKIVMRIPNLKLQVQFISTIPVADHDMSTSEFASSNAIPSVTQTGLP